MTWTYPALVMGVIDGDTLRVDLDMGLHVHMHIDLRLDGCNAAEHGTPAGDAATANLRALLTVGAAVTVTTTHLDKYGRALGRVLLADGNDLTTVLIAAQWAAAWNGQGPRPVPPWPRTVTP